MAGSEWAKSQDGLLWLKTAVKTIESNWAKRNQLEFGSSWAWPILTRNQIGPRSQYWSEHINQEVISVFQSSSEAANKRLH